ncbi:hypothetical protein LCGC14_1808850 [marine sediment metagenome]|uniref:Uncharacterized protein n=1 Tax=marine sediment metagenome TaxID=412755 RepID=A0A0F9HAF9_9ZZZZ
MSMNLHCDEIELEQIPTWITYMIYSPDKNNDPCGGWHGVLYRLKQWYGHEKQIAFNSAADNPREQEWIDIDYLNKIECLNSAADRGPLTFYIM